jgi:hypothetical protein
LDVLVPSSSPWRHLGETILHSTKGMPQIRRVTDERVHAITQISVE